MDPDHIRPDFPSIAEPHPDMNAAFTVSEKSSNTSIICACELQSFWYVHACLRLPCLAIRYVSKTRALVQINQILTISSYRCIVRQKMMPNNGLCNVCFYNNWLSQLN